MYTIHVLTDGSEVMQVLKKIRPYQTLLEVCLNNKIQIGHDCGGVCHCTTCHIYIEKGADFIVEASRRETDFLKRINNQRSISRLACQSLLLEGGGLIEILIPKAKEE